MRLAVIIAMIAIFTSACNSSASEQDYKDSIEADRVADSLMRGSRVDVFAIPNVL